MAKKTPTENLTLKGMEILRTPFRNFSGSPTKFNAEGGERYFEIRLDKEKADELRAAGWRVKELDPREEGDEPLWLLNVKVKFGQRPPRIVSVINGKRTPLNEDTVDALDSADIAFADIIIRPYNSGREFPSAYLQTGFFNVKLDELEALYDMDDEDEVVCDEDGVCYIGHLGGIRIN